MPTINFSGLASGLDTKALIDAILSVERKPIEQLQARQSTLGQRKAALDELRSKLAAFEGALRDISLQGTFRGRTGSVGDESVLRASPSAGAEIGLFAVEVSQLAAAHKVKSAGLSAADEDLVTAGTITIQSGANDPITIDVNASNGNNTLNAVRDAINSADAGVSAAIIFDGTDYLLTVRADESGADNALAITDTTNLALDQAANLVTAAADAQFTVDGINVSSSTNRVSTVIPGVTLELLKTNLGSPVNVEVAADIDGVVGEVDALIDQYNELMDFFNSQDSRDSQGPLAGDLTLRQIKQKVQSLFTGGVPGIPVGEIRALSSIGVSFDGKTGRASLDTSVLRELLETRFDDVGDVFLSSGSASDPRIQFLGSSTSTLSGDYAVEITQAAERATLLGSAPINPAGINNDETLTITVNGDTVTVNLLRDDTITDIVDKINAEFATAGVDAAASDSGGALQIATTQYGDDQTLTVESNRNDTGNGKQSGFDNSPVSDTGQTIAGSIGGSVATGNGRVLTAADDGPYTGISLKVTASAQDVIDQGGDFGIVSFGRGLVNALVREIDQVTKFDSGPIDLARERLDSNIERISEDIARIEERLVSREARLLKAFTAAERAISLLQSQQASLGSVTGFGF